MFVSKQLKIIKKIGQGAFSQVYLALDIIYKKMVAVKFLKKKYKNIDEVKLLPEFQCLVQVRGHPCIITLLDVYIDPNTFRTAMIFELMNMNLLELLQNQGEGFDETTSLILIFQLLKAVEFIHYKGIFHRDIKPENCMVNKDTFELKLCDFGSTKFEKDSIPFTEYICTRWYRAPECILTKGLYGASIDIWSVGCMLFELLTFQPLFPGKK